MPRYADEEAPRHSNRAPYRSPARSPARHHEAEEINQSTVTRTNEGRQAAFETRMAMQRELDAARSQLRSMEREMDDLQRQAVGARDEAAVARSENGRLQDELRSCRERLNAALDSQQELLGKNAQKHELLIDLQAQVAGLRDEIVDKDARARVLEDTVARLEQELRTARHQASADNSARDAYANLSQEHDVTRSELRSIRSDHASREAHLRTLEADRAALRADVSAMHERIIMMERELDLAKSQAESANGAEAAFRDHLASKDDLIAELHRQKVEIEAEFAQFRSMADGQTRSLENQLDGARAKEQMLEDNLRTLHRTLGRQAAAAMPNPQYPLPVTNVSTRYVPVREVPRAPIRESVIYRTHRYEVHEPARPDPTGGVREVSRRVRRYMDLVEEKDEAERLADIARERLRRSLREDQ